MTTQYAGIDYGLGKTNIDKAAGIRFGAISRNSVNPDALEDIYRDGKNLTYQSAVDEIKGKLWQAVSHCFSDRKRDEIADSLWEAIANDFNDNYQEDNDRYSFSESGFTVETMLDNDLIVTKSPYYTHAQFCSPCVPGAGNLDSPCEYGAKTFCLGHEWFDDGKAPYPVYSVSTGEIVNPV